MKREFPRILCIGVLVLLGVLGAPGPVAAAQTQQDWPIIKRKGDQLFEGERSFRFFGLAAPNIQQNESQIRPDFSNRFPDDFETRDVLRSLQQMGARATRSFSLSIFSPEDGGIPVYVTARRTYNEAAFRSLDRVLALCREYDVRLIIPIIASQRFATIRGVDEFSALAGKPQGSFWIDEDVKADFKHLLDYMLNRRNTVSGMLYKDDPAILAWQLGNEFGSYAPDRKLDDATWDPRITAWSLEMAATLKKLDPKHLVMEAGGGDRKAYIADRNIDIISTHLYEYWNKVAGRPSRLAPLAVADRDECRGKKALIIDEFGLGGYENIRELMRSIREEGIVGGLLWSIRGHRRDGGFYYHNEGGTPINSYHFPGFASGFAYEEQRFLDLLRVEAYAIRDQTLPALAKPSPSPFLMRLGGGFTWRGSAGASSYTLERSEPSQGVWKVIATGLQDSVIADAKGLEDSKAYTPQILYVDETAIVGKSYCYRIKGENAEGETGYSDVVAMKR